MKITAKKVFESDNWVITKIINNKNKTVRIDAHTRFLLPDKQNRFSEWISLQYANRLSRENFGKNVDNFQCYKY